MKNVSTVSFLLLSAVFGILVKYNETARLPANFLHTNLCALLNPAPVVYLNNYFNSNDSFFPNSYTERRCAPTSVKQTSRSNGPSWPTCLNGKYHCVTRYRLMSFLRVPRVKNATFTHAVSGQLRVPVACECCDFSFV